MAAEGSGLLALETRLRTWGKKTPSRLRRQGRRGREGVQTANATRSTPPAHEKATYRGQTSA